MFRALVALLLFCAGASAQDRPPVLTIDPDRLLIETAFGQRILGELEARADAIQAEIDATIAALEAEERDLTERRAGMEPAEFRTLADAFDAKVVRLRDETDARDRDFAAEQTEMRAGFFRDVQPILAAILRERGATVILRRSDIYLALDTTDITDEAVERIDDALGEGTEGGGADAPVPGVIPGLNEAQPGAAQAPVE